MAPKQNKQAFYPLPRSSRTKLPVNGIRGDFWNGREMRGMDLHKRPISKGCLPFSEWPFIIFLEASILISLPNFLNWLLKIETPEAAKGLRFFPPSLSFNLWECFYPVFPQWESRQGWETHTIERSHAWQQGSRNHYNFPKEAIGKKPRVSTGTWQIKFQAEEFSVTWVLVGDGLQVWAPVVNSWGDAKVRALDPTSVTQILRVVASCVSWTKDQP